MKAFGPSRKVTCGSTFHQNAAGTSLNLFEGIEAFCTKPRHPWGFSKRVSLYHNRISALAFLEPFSRHPEPGEC